MATCDGGPPGPVGDIPRDPRAGGNKLTASWTESVAASERTLVGHPANRSAAAADIAGRHIVPPVE